MTCFCSSALGRLGLSGGEVANAADFCLKGIFPAEWPLQITTKYHSRPAAARQGFEKLPFRANRGNSEAFAQNAMFIYTLRADL